MAFVATNASLRTFLETLDAETVSFVTFCLDELAQTKETGERSALWMCATKKKAMALAQSLIHVCNAKIGIKKADPVYQLTARWEAIP
jgi:hypothetical protein